MSKTRLILQGRRIKASFGIIVMYASNNPSGHRPVSSASRRIQAKPTNQESGRALSSSQPHPSIPPDVAFLANAVA